MRTSPLALAASRCLALALSLSAGQALAGNFDSFPLGNEAAMTGGAVHATIRDASALHYNPAGLAGIDRDSVDGSATALALRTGDFPGAVRARGVFGEVAGDAHNTVLLSVPSSLAIAKRLSPAVALGVGVFVPQHDRVDAGAKLEFVVPGFRYSATYGVIQQSTTYHVAAGLGLVVSPRVRLGLALVGVYQTTTAFFDFAAGLDRGPPSGLSTGVVERKASIDVFALSAIAGLQATPVDGLEVAAVLRLPALAVAGQATLTGFDQATTAGATTLVRASDSLEGTSPLIEPLRAHVGVARSFQQGYFGVSFERSLPVTSANGQPRFAASWNAQIGGRAWVSENVALGGGVFTDLSATPTASARGAELERLDRVGSARIDYVGLMTGIEVRRRYATDDGQRRKALDFSTTLALRYAHGTGTVQGALIRPLDDAPNATTQQATPATAHELNVHIGSALYF
jgi:hypothetical protein